MYIGIVIFFLFLGSALAQSTVTTQATLNVSSDSVSINGSTVTQSFNNSFPSSPATSTSKSTVTSPIIVDTSAQTNVSFNTTGTVPNTTFQTNQFVSGQTTMLSSVTGSINTTSSSNVTSYGATNSSTTSIDFTTTYSTATRTMVTASTTNTLPTTVSSASITTSTIAVTTTAQVYTLSVLIRFANEVWIDDYNDQQSIAFMKKSSEIEQKIIDTLKIYSIKKVVILNFKQGSIIANISIVASQPLVQNDITNTIILNIPGTSVYNPNAGTLPDWAVIIIAVSCTIFVIGLAFIVTAILCRRRRLHGYNRYETEHNTQTIEMNENWKYPQRNSAYQDVQNI